MQDWFEINLICQPAQSLTSIYCAWVSLGMYNQFNTKYFHTIAKLLNSVEEAYNCYDPKIINYTWLHLTYVMVEIPKVKGEINYKNPHKGKKKNDRLGILQAFVKVSDQQVTDTINTRNKTLSVVQTPEPWSDMDSQSEAN